MKMLVTLAYEAHATVEVDVPDDDQWDDKVLTQAALEVVEAQDWETELAWVDKKRPADA